MGLLKDIFSSPLIDPGSAITRRVAPGLEPFQPNPSQLFAQLARARKRGPIAASPFATREPGETQAPQGGVLGFNPLREITGRSITPGGA